MPFGFLPSLSCLQPTPLLQIMERQDAEAELQSQYNRVLRVGARQSHGTFGSRGHFDCSVLSACDLRCSPAVSVARR